MIRFGTLVIASILLLFLAAPFDRPADPEAPIAQESPLSGFELHPDFQIELVAAEPVVADPIDMEIDEYGRMYVLEFHSYPNNWSGADRIVQLRDTDGDGTMDESTVFADSLVQSMGIMRWKDGLIVTAPPEVIYLEDSDGDGRADVRRVLLTGFHQGDGEGDVNNPTYGLDNWVYLGNRRTSGEDVRFAPPPGGPRAGNARPGDAPSMDGPSAEDLPYIPSQAVNRNIRFRPDTYEIESQSSGTQYGFAFDTWGHQLLNSNRNHIFEEVVPARYLDRNPNLLVSSATEAIPEHGAAAKVFPITENPDYQILTDVGEITSACGITFYDGGAFPEGFENVSFVGEPSHNLVHADRLHRAGPALAAERIRPHNEFLASKDAMFRPVNFYVGPDGALYVVDYYRKIIEGPEWLSDEVLASGTLYDGTELGRIYRITPKDAPAADWTTGLDLGDASTEELVAHLANPNGWWRRNAQRLLVDRQAVEAVPDLETLVEGPSAVGRLHALWTLEGLGRLDPTHLLEALSDDEPGVRENAIRLAERYLDDVPVLEEALLDLRSDADPKVRFQLLLTLGYIDTPRAAEVRQELLFSDVDNEWTQIAALSSPYVEEGEVLETILDRYEPEYASFVQRLSALTGANRPWERVLELTGEAVATPAAPWQVPVLEGLAQGMDGREVSPEFRTQLGTVVEVFFDHPSPPVRRGALNLLQTTGLPADAAPFVERAVTLVRDADAPPNRRAQAVEFLTLGDPARHESLLTDLIDPSEATSVQVAAFRALGAVPGTMVSELAMDRWSVLTREVRDAALDVILARPFQLGRVEQLLGGLAEGIVQPGNIGWGDKVTLMRDIPDDMKRRARALIRGTEEEVRQETAQYVETVADRTPDPEGGRAVFYQSCAQCHALGDIAPGTNVGPDLMSVRGWSAADVVTEIVRPNASIVRGYELWRFTLSNGETVEGMIASETANAVTVRDANGRETTYARRSIQSLNSLEVSVMPDNFDELLTPQEMADLVAFVRVGE